MFQLKGCSFWKLNLSIRKATSLSVSNNNIKSLKWELSCGRWFPVGHFNHGLSHMIRIIITSIQAVHYFIVYFMFSCYMIYVKYLEIKFSSLVNTKTKNNNKQECIPVGCVPPACYPYLPVCTDLEGLPAGGIYLPRGVPARVYLPWGWGICLGVGGCTCPGGCAPALRLNPL